jgi:quercetin dioxygenase-like cupin family protein
MTTSSLPRDVPSFRAGYSRVCTSADGRSHFRDEVMEMIPGVYVPGIPLVDSAEPRAATAVQFSRVAAGYESAWHPAPRRQFVLILAGVLEVTVGDGAARRFGPGSVVLVEDTAGQGHQTRALGTDDAVWAAVAVTTLPEAPPCGELG